MDENKDLLERAVINIRHKVLPRSVSPKDTIPEPHIQLYGVLQIEGIPDEETINRAKYIYHYFKENGVDPHDGVIDVYTKVGNSPFTSLIDRVYKYIRLQDQANRTLRLYKTLERELDAFGSPRRKR